MLALLLACFVSDDMYRDRIDGDDDGFVAVGAGGDDCDDDNDKIHPGAFESCLDTIDSDCDGVACPESVVLQVPGNKELIHGTSAGDAVFISDAAVDMDGDGAVEVYLSARWMENSLGGMGAIGQFELEDEPDQIPFTDAAALIETEDATGLIAHALGDTTGDGTDDLAVATMAEPCSLYVVTDPLTEDLDVRDLAELGASADVSDGSAIIFGDILTLPGWQAGTEAFVVMSPGHEGGRAWLITAPVEGRSSIKDAAAAEISAEQDGDQLGSPVGTAPDTDDDGIPEILLSARKADFEVGGQVLYEDVGRIYLIHDITDDKVNVRDSDATFQGIYSDTPLRYASGMGDLNGDGYDEVGIYQATGPGDVLIFHGPVEGEYAADDADIHLIGDSGTQLTADFGAHLFGSHDINGDSLDDAFIAAPREGVGGLNNQLNETGALYLFYGPVSGVLGPDHAAATWHPKFEEGLGGPAHVTDLDGDGVLDMLINQPGATPEDSGAGVGLDFGAVSILFDPFAEL